MEEHKHIKDYIVDYLLEDEDEKRLDPVLAEWLAEDESHRKEFDLYKKIWKESHRYIEPEIFDPDLAWAVCSFLTAKISLIYVCHHIHLHLPSFI